MTRQGRPGPSLAHRHTARDLAFPVAATVSVALFLGGCMVGPDYAGPPSVAPRTEVGNTFVRGTPATADAPVARWWTALGDSQLTDLVERALEANTEVRTAWARLRQSRAVLGGRTADLAPRVGSNAVALNNQIPIGTFLDGQAGTGVGGQTGSQVPKSIDIDIYSATFDASWEIDLFGGRRRAVEQAGAEAEAAEARIADAQVQVAAETAQAYVSIRGAQRRSALIQRSAGLQRRSLVLAEQRLGQGAGSALDVERLRAQYENTASTLPAIRAEIDAGMNRLAVLLALEPGAVDGILRTPRPIPTPPRSLATGDPSGMLRRRPDIRQAERQLVAANARVGQAVARLFPRVTLLGNAGWVSPDIGAIGTAAAATYTLGPTLQWSILDFGRTLAQIRQAEAGSDEAVLTYERAVLGALQDAETALSRYRHQRTALARLTRASASAVEASRLTGLRNEAGTIGTVEVIEVERQRLEALQSLARAETETTLAYVALMKGLGLGWGPPATIVAVR